jgi:hypothetical protein
VELPNELKALYRHWDGHVVRKGQQASPQETFHDEKLFEEISWFTRERLSIWGKKWRGEPPPYTSDPILARYRFCNVFREFDRQTIEFHTLLNPIRDDFPLWLLNIFYYRMVARPETVRAVGLLSFDEVANRAVYEKLSAYPRPRYGTPYVFPVSTILRSETPTRELFVTQYLPSVMRKVAQEIEEWQKIPVADGVERIVPLFGFKLKFLWTEVLIDLAYQFPERIDLFARFPVGPGALPTFKRIDAREEPSLLAERLAKLQFDSGIIHNGTPLILSAENWEGVGCEFRKYTNLKAGRGRRRLYAQKGSLAA